MRNFREISKRNLELQESERAELEKKAKEKFISRKGRIYTCDWKNLLKETLNIDNYNKDLWNTTLELSLKKGILNHGERGSIFLINENLNLNPLSYPTNIFFSIKRYYFETLKEAVKYREAKFPQENNIRFATLIK